MDPELLNSLPPELQLSLNDLLIKKAFYKKCYELQKIGCGFVALEYVKTTEKGNVYRHPKEYGKFITKISLEIYKDNLWISFIPIQQDGSIKKDGHRYLLCPNSRKGFNCGFSGRRGYVSLDSHKCTITSNQSLDHLMQKKNTDKGKLSSTQIQSSEKFIQFSDLSTSFVQFVGHCNVSFRSASSSELNNFLQLLIQIAQQNPTLPARTIFPLITERKVSNMLSIERKRIESERYSHIENVPVGVMIDGGAISGKKYTAVSVVPLTISGKPIFWKLYPACYSSKDYENLALNVIREITICKSEVHCFCSDGLLPQRKALQQIRNRLFSDEDPQHLFAFGPFFIYCMNHLTNLIIVRIFSNNQTLKTLKETIVEFSKSAHNPRIYSILKTKCPTYVATRWLCLYQICRFIRVNKKMILQAELLDSNTVSDIIRTEILLLPLQQLHFFFENETSKLGGAFPELLKALGRYFVILNQPSFKELQWSICVCEFLIELFNSFLSGPRGDMIALAYVLTPNGLNNFRKGEFASIFNLEIALFKFNIEAEQNQIVSSSKSNQTTTEPSDDVSKDSSQFFRYSNLFTTSTVFDPLKYNEEEQASSSTDNSSACKESQFPQAHFSDPTSIDENQTSTSLFNSFVSDPKGIETPLSITSFHSAISFSEGIHLSHKKGLGFATTITEGTSSHFSEGSVSITNKNDELLDKLLRIFELASKDISNKDEANDFSICEDFEDLLGLTDAELEAENDEFKCFPTSSENLMCHSTRYTDKTSSDMHTENEENCSSRMDIEDIEEPTSSSNEEIELDVYEIGSNEQVTRNKMTTEDDLKEISSNIESAITSNWSMRIISSFNSFIENIFSKAKRIHIDEYKKIFYESLYPTEKETILVNPFTYYSIIGSQSKIHTIYANICMSLIASPCSEAPCERVFSKMRRIVGDRRHSLSEETLNTLLLV